MRALHPQLGIHVAPAHAVELPVVGGGHALEPRVRGRRRGVQPGRCARNDHPPEHWYARANAVAPRDTLRLTHTTRVAPFSAAALRASVCASWTGEESKLPAWPTTVPRKAHCPTRSGSASRI